MQRCKQLNKQSVNVRLGLLDVSSKQRFMPYTACLRAYYKIRYYSKPLRGDSGKFIGR